MGVNHDQFSHFSRFRPGSSAAILQMVVILALNRPFGGLWTPNRARSTWSV